MSPPTILYAWERGRGFGHVAGFAALADRLLARDCQMIAAVRHRRRARALLDPRIPVIRAPRAKTLDAKPKHAVIYSDLLAPNGFGDPRVLRGLVEGWRMIVDEVDPALVVCNAAPGALLALRVSPRPAVTLGDGFTVPPRAQPMPWLRPWIEPFPEPRLRRRENVIARIANKVLTRLDGRKLTCLADLFEGAPPRLCTIGELDHYARADPPTYHGALAARTWGTAPSWGPARPRVFAYLHPGDHLAEIVAAMGAGPGQYVLYCPDAPDDLALPPTVTRLAEPARLDAVLADADALVSNGGHGVTAAFVCAGKPVLVLPHNLEQALTGFRVRAAGVGLAPDQEDPDYGALLRQLVEDDALRSRAQAVAEPWHNPESRLDALADDLARLAHAG